MKTITAFAFALCLSAAAFAEQKTETVKVKGWHCDHCPGRTEAKVKHLKGVKSAVANREAGELKVTYDDAKVKHADIEKAVSASGFEVAKD